MAFGKLFGFEFSHRRVCVSLRRRGCHHLLCARLNLRKVLPRLRRVRVPPIRTLRMTQFTGATVATLSTPGVEPGLSRPQRDVLTTRRCGRYECAHEHHTMLRYEIAITNTPVAADSEILESFTIEPHTTADPLLTKGTLTTLKFGCRPCYIWTVLEVGYPDSFKCLAIILATFPRRPNQADPTQSSLHSLQCTNEHDWNQELIMH